MTTNILKLFVVVIFIAAASTVTMAQQPFDDLPPTQPLENAKPQDDPIIVPPRNPAPGSGFQTPDPEFADIEPDQSVEVDERYAGWQAAGEGTNGGRISKTLRASWVMADVNGLIRGTVRGVDDAEPGRMNVYLLNRGRLVNEVTTDDDGNFELSNVIEGAYSLIGVGENAFFSFSLNVLHHTVRDVINAPERIDVLAFQNKTTINLDWIRYFSPKVEFRVFGRYSAGQAAGDPAEFFGFDGLAADQPPAVPATSISGHDVVKTADGRLLGRVHQLNSLSGRPVNLRNTKVMLLKGDDIFATTRTDYSGVFEFLDTPEGQYGLVAAGVDGMGSIGIEVVGFDEALLLEDDPDAVEGATVFDFCLASSESVGWLNHLAINLAYERAILAPRPNLTKCKPWCPYCPLDPNRKRGIFRESAKVMNNWFDNKFYGDGSGSRPSRVNLNETFQDYYNRPQNPPKNCGPLGYYDPNAGGSGGCASGSCGQGGCGQGNCGQGGYNDAGSYNGGYGGGYNNGNGNPGYYYGGSK